MIKSAKYSGGSYRCFVLKKCANRQGGFESNEGESILIALMPVVQFQILFKKAAAFGAIWAGSGFL